MKVLYCNPSVRQRGADGGSVAGVGVDDDDIDRVAELGTAPEQPRPDRGAGPAVDLPQQGLLAGDVDEPGFPGIRALPTDPPGFIHAIWQPPRPPEPGLIHA